MKWISEENIKDMRTLEYNAHTEFKVTVTAPRNVIFNYLGLGSAILKERTLEVRQILKYFRVYLHLKRNKREDKIILGVPKGYVFPKRVMEDMYFQDGKFEDLHDSKVAMNEYIHKRHLITAGYALSALIPGSKVAGYAHQQRPKNRKFQTNHDEIYQYLMHFILPEELTGDYKKDFSLVYRILWMHFPHDITNYDRELKLNVLERGLLDMNFAYF